MGKRKKDWRYSDAKNHQVGVMVCNYCKKAITTGQFKFYADNDGCFRGHAHRQCTPDDPKWGVMDRAQLVYIEDWQKYLDAMKAFRAQWQTDVLDEEIEEYEELISKSKQALQQV